MLRASDSWEREGKEKAIHFLTAFTGKQLPHPQAKEEEDSMKLLSE